MLRSAPAHETLALQHPPTHYYSSHCEDMPKREAPLRLSNRRQAGQERAAGDKGAAAVAITAAVEQGVARQG